MKPVKTTRWDAAEHINSREDVAAYLEATLEENDTALLLAVFGDIARSKGIAQIARDLNVARESLYRSLTFLRQLITTGLVNLFILTKAV